MSTDIESQDWACLGPWWSTYAHIQTLSRNPASARVFGLERLSEYWDDLDSWWGIYADSVPTSQKSTVTSDFVLGQPTRSWDQLDPWWEIYIKTGHATAVKIAELLEQSNQKWSQSDGPFNTDPLAADLSQIHRGPVQPINEVGWSQWLATLLASSAALNTEVFGIESSQPPDKVLREDQLSKQDGSFRRPDILLLWPDRGVSIEVKLGDEHYQKTAETAELIERHYDGQDWTHTLLLPERKIGRLESIIEPSMQRRSGGQLQVEWEDPGAIAVIHWRDVTAAIRRLLCGGTVVDDHWAANAYLLCATVEQQIVGFQPQPVIERLAAPSNVVDTLQPIGLASILEEQLTYLRAGLEA